MTLRGLHKWISLTVVAMWLLQAVTGIVLVFHWELDEPSVLAPSHLLDPVRLGTFLERLQASDPQRRVSAVYASGGLPGRFDVNVEGTNGTAEVLRVDGVGTVLRERPADHDVLHIGMFQIATIVHQNLFLGQAGRWLIGISGLILLSNLSLGLYLAWPRRGQWLRTLIPANAGATYLKFYAWHRAAGLWLIVPMFALVFAGVLMAWDVPLARWFDDTRPSPSPVLAQQEPLAPRAATAAYAIQVANRLYPGALLAAVNFPKDGQPWFAVRVTQPGEARRFSGQTIAYISSRSGRVLGTYDALKVPLKTRIWDALYAFHTGEIGGSPGRWLAATVGISLLTIITLGLTFWATRRAYRLDAHAKRTAATHVARIAQQHEPNYNLKR